MTAALIAIPALYALWKGVDLARTANAADRLMINPVGLKLAGISQGNLNVTLNLEISNPSGKSLYVDYIFLDISLEGKKLLAKIREESLGNKYPISANSTTIVPIPIRVSLFSLILTAGTLAVDAITKGNLPKSVQIKGTIKVAGIPTDFDKSIPFTKA